VKRNWQKTAAAYNLFAATETVPDIFTIKVVLLAQLRERLRKRSTLIFDAPGRLVASER